MEQTFPDPRPKTGFSSPNRAWHVCDSVHFAPLGDGVSSQLSDECWEGVGRVREPQRLSDIRYPTATGWLGLQPGDYRPGCLAPGSSVDLRNSRWCICRDIDWFLVLEPEANSDES